MKLPTTGVRLQYMFVDDWFIFARDPLMGHWYMMNTECSPLWLHYGIFSDVDQEPNAIEKYIVSLLDWDKLYESESDLLEEGWVRVGQHDEAKRLISRAKSFGYEKTRKHLDALNGT